MALLLLLLLILPWFELSARHIPVGRKPATNNLTARTIARRECCCSSDQTLKVTGYTSRGGDT